ncbi:short-chain dehydrogenase reductase sdr protein [Cordyceps javanica]|uniref:Short-chain dehydrogenase reductase sdr protein n=1 Tax=Cordyceps javanica TaxID=43265 RepID=A0A545VS43_9HYPO|nr:short-chain dehydrogenase reductase sdr protein [Cordyceps javanica]TQW04485.1 short-chain dehydrogenase reductase sdr protein [Cordyceps javanica]
MAMALGLAGAKVVLVARRPAPLHASVQQFREQGIDAVGLPHDVRNVDAIKTAVSSLLHGPPPDILVNAAGINTRVHMSRLAQEDWDETIAVNLTAAFQLGQAFGPAMAERGSGRIINVVSQQSIRAFGNSSVYGVSKAGLAGLTRSQAEAWSPRGVLCNAIAPGFVETPLTAAACAEEGVVAKHVARTMVGRNGAPADFAGAAIYLASSASDAVTGTTLFVDGGYNAT